MEKLICQDEDKPISMNDVMLRIMHVLMIEVGFTPDFEGSSLQPTVVLVNLPEKERVPL